jgi:pimeloyl-ACP methyl ester carboxylesterase
MQHLWQIDSIKTRDGLKLYGILSEPEVFDSARTAVIFVHGLTSAFYHGLSRAGALQEACQAAGYALALYNNRGHDVAIPGMIPGKSGIAAFGGSGFERFEDCLHDIDAVISHLKKKGYKKFVLIGHSTGANKVAYYLAKRASAKNILGGVLLSAISDIAGELAVHKKEYLAMRAKVSTMKSDEIVLSELGPYLMSPARFKSLYTPGGSEDMFPYYDKAIPWKLFSLITTPLLVCVGQKDEWLDRPVAEYLQAFVQNAPKKTTLQTVVIPGANHGYKKREQQLAQVLIQWIQNL